MFRVTARKATQLCVSYSVSADAISYGSIVAALAGAICFWRASTHPWLLFVAPLFCYLRLWCNMLDGMVAVTSGTAGRRGEILNDLPDRISDVAIFAGVAHSGFIHPILGYWAAIFSLITAYVGLLGQAVGATREFGGVMSKPWRMVALHIGAWATFACLLWNGRVYSVGRISLLDWTCLLVVLGCVQTITVRLRRTLRSLSDTNEK